MLLPGALPPAAVAEAKAAWDWSLAHPGPGASRVRQTSDATFYQDLFNPDCLTGYRAMLEASPCRPSSPICWARRTCGSSTSRCS